MSAPLLLSLLVACFPQLQVPDGAGGGLGDDTSNPDGGGGDEGGGEGGGSGGEGGGSGDEGGDDGGARGPELDAVSPAHGSNAGGLTVRIEGAHLEPDARVFFGDAEATVQNRGASALDVVVPAASGVTGSVDIKVVTDAGEVVSGGAFTYWADASGDAVVHIRSRVVEVNDDEDVYTNFYALGAHTNPIDAWLSDLQAVEGSCSPSFPSDAQLLEGPPTLALEGGPGRYEADWMPDEEVHYYDDDSTTIDSLEGARMDVSMGPGGAWPPFQADEGLTYPSYVRMFSPNPNDPYSTVNRDNLQITWTATGADRVMLGLQDFVTGTTVVCATTNSGAFTVPDSAFADFEPYEQEWWTDYYVVQFTLVAYRDTTTTLPFNNGELRAQGGIGYSVAAVVEDSTW